jgi:hypothetical protein
MPAVPAEVAAGWVSVYFRFVQTGLEAATRSTV